MKNKINFGFFALCLTGILIFSACEEKDPRFENNDNPMEITAVHLQDGDDDVTDRTVTFARLGQLIRLEGKGFFGVKSVYINGESAYANPTLLSDNSLIVRVPSTAPTTDADDDVRNTIVLKKANLNYTYPFEIRESAPSITNISHTLPQAGEEITIYGSGLIDITSIVFPGDITVNEGITFDEEDGKWCKAIVPEGVSEDGGSILVLGANGGAYSPAYFNCKKHVVHNFDDVNNQSWSGGTISENLSAKIPTEGVGPKSQGTYRSLNTPGNTIAADAPKVAYYWAKQNMWGEILNPLIPGSTPCSEVAVQMDIYVEGVWNSGYIRIVVADGWGTNRYCMLYAPWESFGKRIPFENPGCWFTITLPFSDSDDWKDGTFADVMTIVQTAVSDKYNQWGPWFDNDAYNDVAAEATDAVIYFDNMRIVTLETPAYSDYADEETNVE
ncbi:MAG: glycan-binding surface protein [Candidatus Symbiothrix sp.]|jgi:hypothetical protein|nr:glycan-binding surface protein [Candidatus Symbiothrix sp.]